MRVHEPARLTHGFSGGGVSQVIVYVEDVNDEVPVFTQRQYNRLGLRETAGIGTSVAVVRATDRDTGRKLGERNTQPRGQVVTPAIAQVLASPGRDLHVGWAMIHRWGWH